MGRLVPLEEVRAVDVVLHHEILGVAEIRGGVGDLVERRDRRPENVEHREGDLTLLRRLDKADVAQRLERGQHQARAHVDQRHRRVGGAERVEDLHLVGDQRHVDDVGQVGMEALERAARRLGVEGASGDLVGGEIVEQGARDRGLADPALVRSHDNDGWLGHWAVPRIKPRMGPRLGAEPCQNGGAMHMMIPPARGSSAHQFTRLRRDAGAVAGPPP